MKNTINKNALVWGISAAAAVFLCGFTAMFILYVIWRRENPSSQLHGLFFYKAAALGDPICLPLITGVLVFDHKNQKKETPEWGKASFITAALAFIVSSAIQAEWLINDNTGSNWSLPETHHFNLGGWYHAVFFVLYLTTAALLFTEHIWYPQRQPLKAADLILYSSLIFFGLLHFIDDYIDQAKPVLSISIAAIILTAVCFAFKSIQNYRLKELKAASYLPVLAGGVIAYLISLTQI